MYAARGSQENADEDGVGDVCDPDLCSADLDGSGSVAFADLLALLGVWGACPGCPADLDDDGFVAFSDLLIMLGAWGDC